jgi:excisionase family DNA binding protein
MASPSEDRFRPAEHLVYGLDGPGVFVDGTVCALLNKILGLDKIRAQVRGQNALLDQTLVAIRLAGIASYKVPVAEPNSAPQPEPVPQSKQHHEDTIGTTAAAAILGISDRAVRKAITEKRLPATCLDGRYRITRQDLRTYMAQHDRTPR